MATVTIVNRAGVKIADIETKDIPGWSAERRLGQAVQTALARGISLRNANLENVDLSGMTFRGVDFEDVTLRGAVLTRTSFLGSNLKGANLRKTQMKKTVLEGTDLTGADARGAEIVDVDISKSTVTGLTITRDQLKALSTIDGRRRMLVNAEALTILPDAESDPSLAAPSGAGPDPEDVVVPFPRAAAQRPAEPAPDASLAAVNGPAQQNATETPPAATEAATPAERAPASRGKVDPSAFAGVVIPPDAGPETIAQMKAAYSAAMDPQTAALAGEALAPDAEVAAPTKVDPDAAPRTKDGRLLLPPGVMDRLNQPEGWPSMLPWPPRALVTRLNQIAGQSAIASVMRRVAAGEMVSAREWEATTQAYSQDEKLQKISAAIVDQVSAAREVIAWLNKTDQATSKQLTGPSFAFFYTADLHQVDGLLTPRRLSDLRASSDGGQTTEARRQQFMATSIASVSATRIDMVDGGSVEASKAKGLSCARITPMAAMMILEEAKARGWDRIVLRGGDEFIRAVRQAAANDPNAPPIVLAASPSLGARMRSIVPGLRGADQRPIGDLLVERSAPRFATAPTPVIQPDEIASEIAMRPEPEEDDVMRPSPFRQN